MGVSDAVEALDGVCLSAGMSSDKALREFTRYVARHPDTKREAAAPAVLRAFKAAWPCPEEPE